MKLKINKACDLSSISVLPPPVRRSNSVSNRPQASQLRSQSAQLRSQSSQQSLSQGFSSQHGMFSQLSQSSLDEALINDQRVGSQERENPVKRISSLPPISCTREESQMPMSRSSANLMHKWNSVSLTDHKCQHSEELEHRVGMMETSLNKIGMVLESVQSDVMQINKETKEVSVETEGIRQKLVVQDSSLQLMNKGQDDIKAIFDGGFKSISEQLRKDTYQDKLQEILLVLSALPEKLETAVLKSQNELCNSFTKEVQALTCRLTEPNPKDQALSNLPPKATSCISAPQGKPQPTRKSAVTPKICVQTTLASKIETGGWKSVKLAKATLTNMTSNKMHLQKGVSSIQQDRECRVFIESDEEDEGFSCLLQEKETGNYWMEEVKEEAEKILRKARRRKRKCGGDVILIN